MFGRPRIALRNPIGDGAQGREAGAVQREEQEADGDPDRLADEVVLALLAVRVAT